MKLLVIPDIHLKPWIFDEADEILKDGKADTFVFLGDLVDDWGQERNLRLYEETLERAIKMAQDYPTSLWCYGNHDVSYLWKMNETGYSFWARDLIVRKLYELRDVLGDRLAFIHKVDKMIFSHAGIVDEYIKSIAPHDLFDDVDVMIDFINHDVNEIELWKDNSPIWARPQYYPCQMYKSDTYLHVVGHTPVEKALYQPDINVLTLDSFSTYSDGTPIGDEILHVVDTLIDSFIEDGDKTLYR